LDEEILEFVGTHKNAILKENQRAISWSTKKGKLDHVSKHGHGKNALYTQRETFCARYQGLNFKLPKYSASGQNR